MISGVTRHQLFVSLGCSIWVWLSRLPHERESFSVGSSISFFTISTRSAKSEEGKPQEHALDSNYCKGPVL
jgi:hypothetical protein